ncbi:hypothetical protein RRF57_009572 [Xylaria bambusicola]|uniref:Uncharacterized protein n=1 Tax=Xylaria bambusicola TaxID=326684 RepID=A0AAN7UV69_9PEZI
MQVEIKPVIDHCNPRKPPRLVAITKLLGLVLGRDVALIGPRGLPHQLNGPHAPELQLVPVAELHVDQAGISDKLQAQRHALELAVFAGERLVDKVVRKEGLGVDVAVPSFNNDVYSFPGAIVHLEGGLELALLQQFVSFVLEPYPLDEAFLGRRGLDGLQGAQLGDDLGLGLRIAGYGEVLEALDVAEG